jgi:hypothetical protein
MARAKMISDYQAIAAERALDDYCLNVLQRQNSDSPVTVNSFVGDIAKVQILDAIGLYNGEEF